MEESEALDTKEEVDDDQDRGDQRQNGEHSKAEHPDKRSNTLSRKFDLVGKKQSLNLVSKLVKKEKDAHLYQQCQSEDMLSEKADSYEDSKEKEIHKDTENVRTAGSGCSSPANSTAGIEQDPRLPLESSGAWSPSASQIHFVADSPLTPTRFRSKSEADTSTNPIHAQAIMSTSVRPKERRTSSSSSTDAQSPGCLESPRGEPAGSASGSLSLHGTVTREGEMLSFVADDLMEKIRQSGDPLKAKDRGKPHHGLCRNPNQNQKKDEKKRNKFDSVGSGTIFL